VGVVSLGVFADRDVGADPALAERVLAAIDR
jgi:hypothetical protein